MADLRLHKFEIQNFKGIEYAAFEWNDLIVLIGENNAGKSTALQALERFLGGSQIKDKSLFRDNETGEDDAIEFVGHFDQLSDRDQEAQAIRGRIWEDQWILKKRFWLETDRDNPDREGEWKELYFSYSAEDVFAGWPDKVNKWSDLPAEYEDGIRSIENPTGRPNKDALVALHMYQQVLNHFDISYIVVHDEDSDKPAEASVNSRVEQLLGANERHLVSPTNIERLLEYEPTRKDKPYQAVKRVEELIGSDSLPSAFIEALNWAYFGQATEPGAAAL